ncbi:MAG: hypothetical protein R6X02_32675 [Enhygromyxa sp.]
MKLASLGVSFDARSDWRLAFSAGCLVGIGSAVFLVIDLLAIGVRDAEIILRISHLVLIAAALVLLWQHRRNPTRSFCTTAVVLMWLPFFWWLWLSEQTAALTGKPWQPFVGHKVLFFSTAAMFPGPAWVGAAMLVALGLHAGALWFHLDLGAPEAQMPIDEPWATLAYWIIAGLLFGYRIHHNRVEHELARVRAEASALRMSTDAFLVIHDLANTPLQVLELALGLLRRRHVGDEDILEAASNAGARLRALRDQLPLARVTSASVDPDALRRLREAAAGERPSEAAPDQDSQ